MSRNEPVCREVAQGSTNSLFEGLKHHLADVVDLQLARLRMGGQVVQGETGRDPVTVLVRPMGAPAPAAPRAAPWRPTALRNRGSRCAHRAQWLAA
jgi:hypothetical protein